MKAKHTSTMTNIREFQEVLGLTKNSPRSDRQTNQLFEADCEIVKLNNLYFCTSTDSVGEEISISLYKDPYLWGWMTVMSSISDLAVTGAKPLGLLLSTQWKFGSSAAVKKDFYRGANAALRSGGVALLGGDSGYSGDHVMTSTIFGTSKKKPLTRVGARPGDYVAVTEKHQTGVGPCIAYRYLLEQPEKEFPETNFRPSPNPQMMEKLRPLLRASIDTSDGLASCLYIVARLNEVGYNLEWNSHLINKKALQFCEKNHFHPLMLWIGDHGDFQSLVFIPEKNLQKAQKLNPNLVVLGQCTDRAKDYTVKYGNQIIDLPFAKVTECARDAKAIYSLVKDVNAFFWNFFTKSR